MNDENRRGNGYLLTGLIIGVLLGLIFSWVFRPATKTVEGSPAYLNELDKESYRILVAAAYAANKDIVRAKARLELLQDDDMYQSLALQTQEMLAQDGLTPEAKQMGELLLALGKADQQFELPSTDTVTPIPTVTESEGSETLVPQEP